MEVVRTGLENFWHTRKLRTRGFLFQVFVCCFQVFKKTCFLIPVMIMKSLDLIYPNVQFSTEHSCPNRGNFVKLAFPEAQRL